MTNINEVKNMKIISIVIISTLTTLAIIGSVYAKPHNPEKAVARMTKKLSLNDTQQNHLRAFFDEKQTLKTERRVRYKARKSNKEKGQHQGPFAAILKKDTISVNEINQTIDEVYAKKRERHQGVLSSFVTFFNSLSTEQQQKVQPMLRKILHRSMGHHNKQRKHKFHMQGS